MQNCNIYPPACFDHVKNFVKCTWTICHALTGGESETCVARPLVKSGSKQIWKMVCVHCIYFPPFSISEMRIALTSFTIYVQKFPMVSSLDKNAFVCYRSLPQTSMHFTRNCMIVKNHNYFVLKTNTTNKVRFRKNKLCRIMYMCLWLLGNLAIF